MGGLSLQTWIWWRTQTSQAGDGSSLSSVVVLGLFEIHWKPGINLESKIWNSIISKLPNPHFLQTYEWGQVKAKYGWSPVYVVWDSDGRCKVETDPDLLSTFYSPVAAALILKRQIIRNGFAARLSILYAPKGPLLDWSNESLCRRVLDDLQSFAKKQGAIFLKIDPDVLLGTGIPSSEEASMDNSGQA